MHLKQYIETLYTATIRHTVIGAKEAHSVAL